jgi:hypothetical protein
VAEIGDLVNSGARRLKTQVLGAPSREWQSGEKIGVVHLSRTGGRDQEISRTRELAE